MLIVLLSIEVAQQLGSTEGHSPFAGGLGVSPIRLWRTPKTGGQRGLIGAFVNHLTFT